MTKQKISNKIEIICLAIIAAVGVFVSIHGQFILGPLLVIVVLLYVMLRYMTTPTKQEAPREVEEESPEIEVY